MSNADNETLFPYFKPKNTKSESGQQKQIMKTKC